MIIATRRCGCTLKNVKSEGERSGNRQNYFDQDPVRFEQYDSPLKDPPIRVCCCCGEQKTPDTCDTSDREKSTERIPQKRREKNVSEMKKSKLPYKEIEAIINNNRVVLRIQKIAVQDEWDPPCDCNDESFNANKDSLDGDSRSENSLASASYGDDVVFRKVEDDAKPSSVLQESFLEPGGTPRRTITVVSHPNEEKPPAIPSISNDNDKRDRKEKKDRAEQPKVLARPIELEENPNLFILKIRKKSDSSEGRENIDLEFRTPRPWLPKPKIIRRPKSRAVVKQPVPIPEEKIEVPDNVRVLKRASKGKQGKRKKGGKKGGKKKKK
ncbi:uncharacterized protein [Venturia canescens]|uniref:uncharacterized protein n=1 Tax=Venturia canescens TaxID=32260 RepID=UPI001C9CCEB7|nr:uncharacterized protein LOC122407315 [Venturia canescens]